MTVHYGIMTGLGSYGQIKVSTVWELPKYGTARDAWAAVDRRYAEKPSSLCMGVYCRTISADGVPMDDPNVDRPVTNSPLKTYR